MAKKRTGRNPLAYLGVEAPTPPNYVEELRSPTSNDYLEFNIGDFWLDFSSEKKVSPSFPTARNVWMLVSKSRGIVSGDNAKWINFAGGDALRSLTGDSGGKVFGDDDHNIDILGGTNISTVGDPGTNSITVNVEQTAVPFTPVLKFGGATTGILYDSQEGLASVIGNLVFFTLRIGLTSKGTATGKATIEGIPFARDSTVSSGVGSTGWSRVDLTAARTNITNLRSRLINSGGNAIVELRLDNNIGAESVVATHAEFMAASAVTVTGVFYLQ